MRTIIDVLKFGFALVRAVFIFCWCVIFQSMGQVQPTIVTGGPGILVTKVGGNAYQVSTNGTGGGGSQSSFTNISVYGTGGTGVAAETDFTSGGTTDFLDFGLDGANGFFDENAQPNFDTYYFSNPNDYITIDSSSDMQFFTKQGPVPMTLYSSGLNATLGLPYGLNFDDGQPGQNSLVPDGLGGWLFQTGAGTLSILNSLKILAIGGLQASGSSVLESDGNFLNAGVSAR